MGSPRKDGNTIALVKPFLRTMEQEGHSCETIWLYEKKIQGCVACRQCQKDWTKAGCVVQDDMQAIFEAVQACDLLVLATPIYCFFCTAPMKAVLDRLMYGMDKYYGFTGEKGPSIWAGKPVALISTCGYRPDKGSDLWEAGMKRYCKHAQLHYLGSMAERHRGYNIAFMDPEKEHNAIEFAKYLCNVLYTAHCHPGQYDNAPT